MVSNGQEIPQHVRDDMDRFQKKQMEQTRKRKMAAETEKEESPPVPKKKQKIEKKTRWDVYNPRIKVIPDSQWTQF